MAWSGDIWGGDLRAEGGGYVCGMGDFCYEIRGDSGEHLFSEKAEHRRFFPRSTDSFETKCGLAADYFGLLN